MNKIEKKIPIFASIYFVIGIIFAFAFAFFYHWSPFAYFSPGFYVVILTWPYQAIGFAPDFLQYGLAGKPL
ncbi:hypothetical protein HY025_05540 [Candidatus Daviesbacteria bacterium]|nr:hypothetical protein [Candidatus Daviesbacteria bacterium]